MSDCNVRVICRFRPVNKRELTEGGDIDVLNNILLFPDECNIQLQPWNNRGAQNFAFDRVFWHPSTTQVRASSHSHSRTTHTTAHHQRHHIDLASRAIYRDPLLIQSISLSLARYRSFDRVGRSLRARCSRFDR